jgi:RHS repeat-associated protein
VEPDGSGGYDYIYQYKDHLGNIRLSYTDANGDGNITVSSDPMVNEIVEENNYYPFGLKHRGYNFGTAPIGNSVAQKWKFGGKEYEDTFGLETYDFGARNYMPDLGRWGNIDPMADSYLSESAYNFVKNNPIYFVDPDGERIEISAIYEKDKNGKDVLDKYGNKNLVGLDIKITGKVLNKSSQDFSENQLSSFASRLSSSIKSSFESASEKGFDVNVSTNISVATEDNPLTETDHAFTIVDDGKIPDPDKPGSFRPTGVVGLAAFGELGVYINTDIVNETPTTSGPYVGTGKTSTGNGTLERSGSHEVGHSANLEHASRGTMDGNLMHQSRRSNAGMKLTKAQLLKIKEDYNKGLLNRGRQFYNSSSKSVGPRKADGSF